MLSEAFWDGLAEVVGMFTNEHTDGLDEKQSPLCASLEAGMRPSLTSSQLRQILLADSP